MPQAGTPLSHRSCTTTSNQYPADQYAGTTERQPTFRFRQNLQAVDARRRWGPVASASIVQCDIHRLVAAGLRQWLGSDCLRGDPPRSIARWGRTLRITSSAAGEKPRKVSCRLGGFRPAGREHRPLNLLRHQVKYGHLVEHGICIHLLIIHHGQRTGCYCQSAAARDETPGSGTVYPRYIVPGRLLTCIARPFPRGCL